MDGAGLTSCRPIGERQDAAAGRLQLAREISSEAVSRQQEFMPIRLPLPAEQATPERGIEVELRRGGMTMKVTWPASATADFAAWTRELLR